MLYLLNNRIYVDKEAIKFIIRNISISLRIDVWEMFWKLSDNRSLKKKNINIQIWHCNCFTKRITILFYCKHDFAFCCYLIAQGKVNAGLPQFILYVSAMFTYTNEKENHKRTAFLYLSNKIF